MSEPIKRKPSGFSKGRAREVALRALQAIEEDDAYLQVAVERYSSRARLDARDRGLALELVMGVERQRLRLDHTLGRLVQRGLSKTAPVLQRILRLAAYQILFLDRVPDHAVLNEAVEQARLAVGPGASRMVNAVLRTLLREGEELPEGESVGDVVIGTSHPKWMVQRWFSMGGPRLAIARGKANNRPAPLTIRVDDAGMDREELIETLVAEGGRVRAARFAPDAVHIEKMGRPFQSPSFLRGEWRAQDEASQLVVLMLDPQPGETVWDVCAAPGGKTRYIARRMHDQGRLLATDVNVDKIERLTADLSDLVCAEAAVYDATTPLEGPAPFDRVLVDAPCSALGIVRRHPEIKWRRSPRDPAARAALQLEILTGAARGVKPGGVLVYSVCTDTTEEGHGVVDAFLAAHADFEIEAPAETEGVHWRAMLTRRDFMKTSPDRHNMDGFFAARFRRAGDKPVEAVEAAPEAVEAAPEAVEAAPEAVEAAPEAVEAAPEAAEATPEAADAEPEVVEVAPEAGKEPTQ